MIGKLFIEILILGSCHILYMAVLVHKREPIGGELCRLLGLLAG